MKNILLVIMLFAIVGFGGNSVEAASGNLGWSQKLKCETNCPRFKVLKDWDDAAVLDKETGLVWEQSPATQGDFINANIRCINLEVSNRQGWRLPTVQELGSLIDTSQGSPALQSGHPFSNVNNDYYWSATKYGTVNLWIVRLTDGDTSSVDQSGSNFVWCVRGGSGVDNQ